MALDWYFIKDHVIGRMVEMKKIIGVYRSQYLPLSETFIYEQIIHLKNYKPVVISSKPIINQDVFPFSSIFHTKKKKEIPSILRKRKAELIHARFGTGGVAMLSVKKMTKLPLLTSFHGSDLSKQLKRNLRYGKSLPSLFRYGDRFTVVSEFMKKQLIDLGCPKKKIEVVKSGIDLSKFAYQPDPFPEEKEFRILTVGRLVEKKGTKYLIQAFSHIHEKYPHSTLVIVGSGEERDSLEKLAEKLEIQDAIKWKGALSPKEVCREMEKCDIFSLPSVTGKDGNQEGIPNVLIEAMALGRPVVATKHAGIPELVIHKKTGYLVPERDEKALAKMIMYVMEHPDEWKPLLKQAWEHVKQEHDIEKQIKKLEAIYNNLLKKKETDKQKKRSGPKRRKKKSAKKAITKKKTIRKTNNAIKKMRYLLKTMRSPRTRLRRRT